MNITVFEVCLNHSVAVPAWEVVIRSVASAEPLLLIDDLLSFVIDVVHWGLKGFTFIVSEAVEDRNVSYSEEINQLIVPAKAILSNFEDEFGLPESTFIISQTGIKDVIVIDDFFLFFRFKLISIWSRHNCVLIFLHFPDSSNVELQVIDIVLVTKSVHGFDNIQTSFRFVFQIKVGESNLLFMFVGKPYDLGVIVTLINNVVISPFIIFGVIYGLRLAILSQVINWVVREFESVLTKASFFLHTESSRLREVVDLHLGSILKCILMVHMDNFMCLQVNDIYHTGADIQNNNFFLIHLAEHVDDIIVLSLKQYISWGIKVDDSFFLAGLVHSHHNKGVIKSSWNTEDFG